jgi:ubiquinone/menaquinone biosynthesis C-methylase UbiE
MFNNYIHFDDLIELWIKLRQRGIKFILSKLNLNKKARTVSAFDDVFDHANWWLIPYIKKYHNRNISGSWHITYEEYVSTKYIKNTGESQTLISFGCGTGNHEIKFAKLNPHLKVIGYDISPNLIEAAKKSAQIEKVSNVHFYNQDVYGLKLKDKTVDYFLFHSSLHHFSHIEAFINAKIKPALKNEGLIIIHEYVGPNRMNFPVEQINFCNACLKKVISKNNRRIFMLNATKNRCYKLGRLRMIISDPSECVDSEAIMPVLTSNFETLEVKSLGGNILMPVLKHISHHFIDKNSEELLELIQQEEAYLNHHQPDMVYAVFKNK